MTDVEFLGAPIDSDEMYTLVIARAEGHVALGTKTRGFGEGQLVLPGGKQQFYLWAGGIVLLSGAYNASRELNQEVGLTAPDDQWRQAGNLYVSTADGAEELQVALFEAVLPNRSALTGSDEVVDPFWADERSLPYNRMPADYALFLPHVIAGNSVTAFIELDKDNMHGSIFVSPPAGQGRMQEISI